MVIFKWYNIYSSVVGVDNYNLLHKQNATVINFNK